MQANRQPRFAVITGSDTGVGKTRLAGWLTSHLRANGVNAAALKPLCSGGRGDARALQAANEGTLSLDEVNPWHFRAALAPVLAARQAGRRIELNAVVAAVRAVARRFEAVILEGAGGLLSPLGEGFDARDWVREFQATTMVVVPNRLGAVNQSRLLIEALPRKARAKAHLVLVEPGKASRAAATNSALLKEWLPEIPVTHLPWVAEGAQADEDGTGRRLRRALDELKDSLRD